MPFVIYGLCYQGGNQRIQYVYFDIFLHVRDNFSHVSVCFTLVSWCNSRGIKKSHADVNNCFFCCKKTISGTNSSPLLEIPECYWIRQDSMSVGKRCHELGFPVIISLCHPYIHWQSRALTLTWRGLLLQCNSGYGGCIKREATSEAMRWHQGPEGSRSKRKRTVCQVFGKRGPEYRWACPEQVRWLLCNGALLTSCGTSWD